MKMKLSKLRFAEIKHSIQTENTLNHIFSVIIFTANHYVWYTWLHNKSVSNRIENHQLASYHMLTEEIFQWKCLFHLLSSICIPPKSNVMKRKTHDGVNDSRIVIILCFYVERFSNQIAEPSLKPITYTKIYENQMEFSISFGLFIEINFYYFAIHRKRKTFIFHFFFISWLNFFKFNLLIVGIYLSDKEVNYKTFPGIGCRFNYNVIIFVPSKMPKSFIIASKWHDH